MTDEPATPGTAARSDRGSTLIAIVGLISLMVVLSAVALSAVQNSSLTTSSTTEQTRLHATVESAIAHALGEINSGVDEGQDGLGALGIAQPLQLNGCEYRVVVLKHSYQTYKMIAVAAFPTFAMPLAKRSSTALVQTEIAFRSGEAALSMAGAMDSIRPHFDGGSLVLDGGAERPGLLFGDQGAADSFLDSLIGHLTEASVTQAADGATLVGAGTSGQDGSEMQVIGNPHLMREAAIANGGTVDLPVLTGNVPTVDREKMATLQRLLVTEAKLAANSNDPDITVIKRDVSKNLVFGSPGAPETVVISPQGNAVRLSGSITGYGTLIVNGDLAIQRGKGAPNPYLDWHGDVIVVGDDASGNATLSVSGGRATVDGALVLAGNPLSGGGTVKLLTTSSSDKVGGRVDVKGALLTIAGNDPGSKDAANVILKSDSVNVEGIMAFLGNRVDLLVEGNPSIGEYPSLNVTGSTALVITDPEGGDTLDFNIRNEAVADFRFEQGAFEYALEVIARFGDDHGGADVFSTVQYDLEGWISDPSGLDGEAELEAAITDGEFAVE